MTIGKSAGGATETPFEAKIGKPLYTDHYKVTSSHSALVDGKNVTLVFFSGNGTLNGNAIKSSGKALVVPRSNGTAYLQGKVNYTAADNGNERASSNFQAVSNGKSFSFGNSIFDKNATGKLELLSNLVGIYKSKDNANRTRTFVMWEWK